MEVQVWWDYKCYCSLSFQSSLCPSLLSFLRSHCKTQAPPCIINVSKPHLIPNNKTASLPCTGQCEAQQTFADGDYVSARWGRGFLSWTLSSYTLCPVLDDMAGGHFWIMQSSLQSGIMSSNWPVGTDRGKYREVDSGLKRQLSRDKLGKIWLDDRQLMRKRPDSFLTASLR